MKASGRAGSILSPTAIGAAHPTAALLPMRPYRRDHSFIGWSGRNPAERLPANWTSGFSPRTHSPQARPPTDFVNYVHALERLEEGIADDPCPLVTDGGFMTEVCAASRSRSAELCRNSEFRPNRAWSAGSHWRRFCRSGAPVVLFYAEIGGFQ